MLTVFTVSAKGLKGVERNGASDAFVKLVIDGQKANLETKVSKLTNPIVRVCFAFPIRHAFIIGTNIKD